MKRATAVRHLEALGEEATRYRELLADEWALESLWMADDILDAPDTLDVITILVAVDVPVEELPWRTLNWTGEGIAERLRLEKLPIWAHGRPSSWPAWNAENRRVRQFWSREEGTDTAVTETLREGKPVEPVAVEPSVFIEQMTIERTVSRAHLATVLDEYWEHPWRREHKGFGIHPEDHLWRASYGLQQIEAALGRTNDAPS